MNNLSSSDSTERLAYRPLEAAKVLGISPSSLHRLTKRGEIPVVIKGNIKLYPRSELNEWLSSQLTFLANKE